MKKKILLMLIVIILIQIALPMVSVIWESGITIKSQAADTKEATVDGITWTYTIDNGNATNVKPKDKTTLPTEVIIPSTLNGYSVTSIGGFAFESCHSLRNIEIPEGVTSIAYFAFWDCSSLTSIEIPEGVTSIGEYVFCGCTSLKSIEILEGVKNIGDYAFRYCPCLESINVNNNNQNYSSKDGVLFTKDKTKIIRYPEGKEETEYIIPSSVTSIGNGAFEYCKSLNISIPEGVTSIGCYAFKYCAFLTSIKIPSSVTSIENHAFEECRSLESIEIPDGVTTIGDDAFIGCSSLTIYCKENSVAETYAKEKNIPYVIYEDAKGDVNGDKKADFMDILAINKHRLGKAELTGKYLKLADVNGDGKVDFMDILQINKYRLGKIESL